MAMACSTHAPELGVGLWDEVKKERDTLGRPALHIIFCRSWLRFCSRHSKAAGTTKAGETEMRQQALRKQERDASNRGSETFLFLPPAARTYCLLLLYARVSCAHILTMVLRPRCVVTCDLWAWAVFAFQLEKIHEIEGRVKLKWHLDRMRYIIFHRFAHGRRRALWRPRSQKLK